MTDSTFTESYVKNLEDLADSNEHEIERLKNELKIACDLINRHNKEPREIDTYLKLLMKELVQKRNTADKESICRNEDIGKMILDHVRDTYDSIINSIKDDIEED